MDALIIAWSRVLTGLRAVGIPAPKVRDCHKHEFSSNRYYNVCYHCEQEANVIRVQALRNIMRS